jgi:tetratricopeptide (TPR) repeat protein
MACDALVGAVDQKQQRAGGGEQVLVELRSLRDGAEAGLSRLSAEVTVLKTTTEQSSASLLENLSAHMGESFKALVAMPFDQLNETVRRFSEIVEQTNARQAELAGHMRDAGIRLVEAESALTKGLALAKECIEEFSVVALQMRETANTVVAILDRANTSETQLLRILAEVNESTNRYQLASSAMGEAVVAVERAAASLDANAGRFERSSGNLEQAVVVLRDASQKTVEESVVAVRRELEISLRTLADGIAASGDKTIAAYEQSSGRLIEAVDERMSDLTERLSAELTTLANRLPAEVESLNQAMALIRSQIQKATHSMDGAVNQLAARTPEILKAQLEQYDRALAKAMDHFSGTLEQWDGKVSSIAMLTGELRQMVTTRRSEDVQVA